MESFDRGRRSAPNAERVSIVSRTRLGNAERPAVNDGAESPNARIKDFGRVLTGIMVLAVVAVCLWALGLKPILTTVAELWKAIPASDRSTVAIALAIVGGTLVIPAAFAGFLAMIGPARDSGTTRRRCTRADTYGIDNHTYTGM
jgi:hypothetical protein